MTISAQEIADILITSERERKGIAQFSDEHPDIPVETAFEAQKLFVQSKLDAGETFVGWKLGLTSRNKQQAMGLEAPLYGRVTSGMIYPHGEPVHLDRLMQHGRLQGVVQLQQAYLDADPPCLEYEYVEGGDLTGAIRELPGEDLDPVDETDGPGDNVANPRDGR